MNIMIKYCQCGTVTAILEHAHDHCGTAVALLPEHVQCIGITNTGY